ncbi:MAG: transposase IS4 [Desulfovibrionaceae bacterium]|nr:MAG: transposase IS4 [Desulfovibrionaceae bacterium]
MNHQLERGGVLVREGAIVDASVVSSARRPTKTLELLPQDREESEGEPGVTETYSDDAEAAWLRKGNKAYYGYKMHVATES